MEWHPAAGSVGPSYGLLTLDPLRPCPPRAPLPPPPKALQLLVKERRKMRRKMRRRRRRMMRKMRREKKKRNRPPRCLPVPPSSPSS